LIRFLDALHLARDWSKKRFAAFAQILPAKRRTVVFIRFSHSFAASPHQVGGKLLILLVRRFAPYGWLFAGEAARTTPGVPPVRPGGPGHERLDD
jgi:hypothetical protein